MVRDRVRTPSTSPLTFDPERRDAPTISAFLQDEISLLNDKLHLIVGSKLEHNDYTDWEIQPNLRARWKVRDNLNVWGSVSRAVRIPSRVESDSDVVLPGGLPLFNGNPEMRAEKLVAYELGLRMQLGSTLALDAAAFSNDYDDVQSFEPVAPNGFPPFPLELRNLVIARSHGVELALSWDASESWRVKAAYSYLDMDIDATSDSRDALSPITLDRAPNHQFSLRSMLDLGENLELDSDLYYVDSLPAGVVDSYLRFDLRLGWTPTPRLELSLVGKNLLDDSHSEFVEFSGNSLGSGLISTEFERSVQFVAKWRFD